MIFDKITDKMNRRKYDKYKRLGYGTSEFVCDESVAKLDDGISDLCREIVELEIVKNEQR